MNYFAHGRHFIDEPYFLAGTAVPDWLNVVDRKVRARSKRAAPLTEDDDPRVAAVARGIVRHHHDDRWFHQTHVFAELSLRLTVAIRDLLAPDDGFRPSFLGHILVEILLDATLIAEQPSRLDAYYHAFDKVDGDLVSAVVERIANRPTGALNLFIGRFSSERFLYDYAEDAKLLMRLNQVMRRVKLQPLPEKFISVLPEARRMVRQQKNELLAGESLPALPSHRE